jgi:long-chain acyl-CoA synthetase
MAGYGGEQRVSRSTRASGEGDSAPSAFEPALRIATIKYAVPLRTLDLARMQKGLRKAGLQEEASFAVREHLAAYKMPRALQFVASVPVTSSGKVMRRMLRDVDDGTFDIG